MNDSNNQNSNINTNGNATPPTGGQATTPPAGQKGDEPGQANAPKFDENGQRIYSQADVDNLVAIQKQKSKPDGYDDYLKWKAAEDAKKQPKSPEVEEYRRKYEETQQQLQQLMNKDATIQAGVSPQFADYVAFQTQKNVSDTLTFSDALAAFIAQNPQYKADASSATNQGQPATTGLPQGSSARQPDGVEKHFTAINPGLKID